MQEKNAIIVLDLYRCKFKENDCLFNIIRLINMDIIKIIDISETYVTHEVAEHLAGNIHRAHNLQEFGFQRIDCNRDDYRLILTCIKHPNVGIFDFRVFDTAMRLNHDIVLEMLNSAPNIKKVFIIAQNSRNDTELNVIAFNFCRSIITDNKYVKSVYIDVAPTYDSAHQEDRKLYPPGGFHPLHETINTEIHSFLQLLVHNESIEEFSISTGNITYRQESSGSEVIKQYVQNLFNMNGRITLQGIPFGYRSFNQFGGSYLSTYHTAITFGNIRNRSNNEMRSKMLFMILWNYLKGKQHWLNLDIPIKKSNTPKKRSRLAGYAKNKTIKYFRSQ